MRWYDNVDRELFSSDLQDAFLELLDDPSPVVRKAVLGKLKENEEAGASFLRSVIGGHNRILARHAARYLDELDIANPQAEFTDFIRSLNYELETGSLLLSRTVYPNIDIGECCGFLDRLAARAQEIMIPPMSAREQCRILNRVLFHEFAFRSGAEHDNDPRDGFLSEVIRRRRGIPLTLSILYILVAQRCRLNLEPVGLPGHYLVGCFTETIPFFIDPVAGGAFRTPEEVLDILRQHNVPPKLTHLAPTPVREVLCSNCRNLASQYLAAHQPEMSGLFARFVDEFEATYRSRTSGTES